MKQSNCHETIIKNELLEFFGIDWSIETNIQINQQSVCDIGYRYIPYTKQCI